MGPAHPAAFAELPLGRLDKLCPADLPESPGPQRADNQLAPLVEHPDFVLLLHNMNIRPAVSRNGIQILPDAVARLQVQAAKLAVTIDAVDIVAQQHGSRYAAMKTVGICLACALSPPDLFDGELIRIDFRIDFQQKRAVIKTADKEVVVPKDRRSDPDNHFARNKWMPPICTITSPSSIKGDPEIPQ